MMPNNFKIILHDWCNNGCGMCYPVCGMEGRSDLFNDTLNTFYLRLYGVSLWDDAYRRTIATNQKE